MEHLVVVPPGVTVEPKRAAHDWICRSWDSVHDAGSGRVYQCFPDNDLEDLARVYNGDNYPRLWLTPTLSWERRRL
jgi:hypothetical protein